MTDQDFAAKYPLHTVMKARDVERATVQEVIDWLEERGLTICEFRAEGYHGDKTGTADGYYYPFRGSKASLIGDFFGVDPQAFDAEKRAMLEEFYPA